MPYIVYSNETIDGIGNTEDEAWEDMLRCMESCDIEVLEKAPESMSDPHYMGSWTLESSFKIGAATEALVQRVRDFGGGIAKYPLPGGVWGTKEEAGEE